ncbi:MAG TPA: hypothetical protein VMS77_03720 [Conexivisphaerales archaeon]|nr:hypothetical protein [Conexivisphaerales archaeon]
MPLVSAAILPHGTQAIPMFNEGKADFSDVTRGMRKAASVVNGASPQTVVVASPHNLRIDGKMAVVRTEFCGGRLEEGKIALPLAWKCDLDLAGSIFRLATDRGLPVVSVNYGTSGGPESRMPLDWGTLVPLWFLRRRVKVVLVTPSREIPWKDLASMGHCIAEAARASSRRVAFVASADQGHAHLRSGPYGFDRASEEYDGKMLSAVRAGKLERLLSFSPEFVESAKPDSFWQTLILLGALRASKLKLAACSYSCPTYFGLLSAAYV